MKTMYLKLITRYGWRGQSLDSEGTVLCVDEDGLLRVGFRNLTRGWKADPRDITRVVGHRVGDWVQVISQNHHRTICTWIS